MAEDQNPLKWYEAWAPMSYGVLLVNRKKIQPSTIKALHKQIKKNEIVCIFPEGTALSIKLKEGKNGASFFAARHEIPIIPVAMFNTAEIQPTGQVVPKVRRVEMVFGEPIYFTGDPTDQGVLRAATNELMEKIAQLSKQEYVPDTYASDAKDAIKKSFKDRTEFDEDDA